MAQQRKKEKLYAQGTPFYVKKLKALMEKLDVTKYDYDCGMKGGYVEFTYKGQARRFEQTVEGMQANGIRIWYASDVFARIVLTIEDLARASRNGIYDFADILNGLPMLPAASVMPDCFRVLQFTGLPATVDELKARYRQLSKTAHPDAGGSAERFGTLTTAYNDCMVYLTGGVGV
jgi:hypothetical protein